MIGTTSMARMAIRKQAFGPSPKDLKRCRKIVLYVHRGGSIDTSTHTGIQNAFDNELALRGTCPVLRDAMCTPT